MQGQTIKSQDHPQWHQCLHNEAEKLASEENHNGTVTASWVTWLASPLSSQSDMCAFIYLTFLTHPMVLWGVVLMWLFMVSMEAQKGQETCPSSHSGARQVGSYLKFRQWLGEGRSGNLSSCYLGQGRVAMSHHPSSTMLGIFEKSVAPTVRAPLNSAIFGALAFWECNLKEEVCVHTVSSYS